MQEYQQEFEGRSEKRKYIKCKLIFKSINYIYGFGINLFL